MLSEKNTRSLTYHHLLEVTRKLLISEAKVLIKGEKNFHSAKLSIAGRN
jgi:hypothetical protein